MDIWQLLEFLLVVHKAVDKVCPDEFREADAAPGLLAELYRSFREHILEIEDALRCVLMEGTAVEEIRKKASQGNAFLQMLLEGEE